MGRESRILKFSFIGLLIIAIAVGTIQRSASRQPYLCTIFGSQCPKYIVKGMVAQGWDLPATVFRNNFEKFREQHAQLTVYHGEDIVIDLYGAQEGHAHKRAGLKPGEVSTNLPYDHDSMQVVFSSSKGVTALVVAMAVDRGYFKYTDKVAQYWPEFGSANNGAKADTTIEQLMRHEARVSALSRRVSFNELSDLDAFAKVLAESPPMLPEGERGYHAVTRGFFVNELIRRTDPKHRSVGQFIKEEIAKPLGIDNTMFLGIAKEDSTVRQRLFATSQDGTPAAVVKTLLPIAFMRAADAVATIPVISSIASALSAAFPIHPLMAQLLGRVLDKTSAMHKTMYVLAESDGTPVSSNTWQGLAYEAPSSNMVTNSRGLAAVAAVLANGGELNGVRLLRKETVDDALSHFVEKYDHVLGLNTTFSRGGWGRNYGQVFHDAGMSGTATSGHWHGWSGWGGSRITFNPERQIAVGYAQTRMGNGLGGLRDERTDALFMAIAQAHDDVMGYKSD